MARRTNPYLKRDDVIQIRYNPANAKQSFYPEARTATKRRILWVCTVVGIFLIMTFIEYLSGVFK